MGKLKKLINRCRAYCRLVRAMMSKHIAVIEDVDDVYVLEIKEHDMKFLIEVVKEKFGGDIPDDVPSDSLLCALSAADRFINEEKEKESES